MKITVITACYNAASFIEDCMTSVQQQTHDDTEHLIIDGASTDGTLEILARTKNEKTRIISEPDDGIYDALNRGIELATGEVIGFLHADDLFAHDRVLETVSQTLEGTELDGCYADLVYVRREDVDSVVRYWKSEPWIPGAFRHGWMPPHPTFFARAKAYEEVGQFNPELSIGADWEFLLRFFEIEGKSAKHIAEVWTKMRMGGVSNQSLRNVAKNNLDTWRACRAHFGMMPSLLFPARKILHRLRQFRSKPED